MFTAAIVIPIYKHPNDLNKSESESISNCISKLSDNDIFMVGSKSICSLYQKIYQGIKFKIFHKKYFKSITGYNQLLTCPIFYQVFKDYSHILIVQTDAWIFGNSSDLKQFLHFDYAGAPSLDRGVFRGYNGGLSLRNVQKCLEVLKNYKFIQTPNLVIKRHIDNQPLHKIILWKWISIILDLTIRNNYMYPFNLSFKDNEDVFWSSVVPDRYPDFHVIDYEDAIRFSWEHNVEEFYTLYPLPFGAHGWWNYHPDFWKNIIK
jgi:hypothetical protein